MSAEGGALSAEGTQDPPDASPDENSIPKVGRSSALSAQRSPLPQRSALGARRFASLILDVDSTLSGIEGVDWLAARRGAELGAQIARLTERAMSGEVPLDAVYGERLALIRPTVEEIARLASAYRDAVAPSAASVLQRLHAAGVRVVLVSGGIREAIVPFAATLGVTAADVYAVHISFDAEGRYAGFDAHSPLATRDGKRIVAAGLELPRPTLMVGDGITDAAARGVTDAFAAFTGFARRESVVRGADYVVESFDQLLTVVLP